MKKKRIISVIIVFIFIATFTLFFYNMKNKWIFGNKCNENQIKDIKALTSDEENFEIQNATIEKETRYNDLVNTDYGIKVKGIVNSRNSNNLNVTLKIESKSCIKKVISNGKDINNQNTDDMLELSMDIQASFNDLIPLKIVMASGAEYDITIPMNKLIITNHSPTKPTINYWPLTTTIKNGRNVILKAENSTDEDGDKIKYIWEGRKAETATYDLGQHTVKVKAVDEWGAESEEATFTFNVINQNAATLSYTTGNNSFNVWGNGNKTTYANAGYSIVFNPSVSGVTLNVNLEEIYDGNYVKINYIINNPTDTDATFNLATHSDIQINNDDRATVTNISGDKGFQMTDGTYYYNFYLRGMDGVDDVSTYWYGQYGQRTSNLWNNSGRADLVGVDSGMAYSWQNKKVEKGKTITLSVILGLE